MLAKIDVWFSSRNVQKAIANTSPKYLARSPVSMRKATKFIGPPPEFSDDIYHLILAKKSPPKSCQIKRPRGIEDRAAIVFLGERTGDGQRAGHARKERDRLLAAVRVARPREERGHSTDVRAERVEKRRTVRARPPRDLRGQRGD